MALVPLPGLGSIASPVGVGCPEEDDDTVPAAAETAADHACGCPTDRGDGAYLAQFIDGAWTRLHFTFSPIHGWQSQATSSTVVTRRDELTIHLDGLEAGFAHGQVIPVHPATWTQQDLEYLGDDGDLRDFLFPWRESPAFPGIWLSTERDAVYPVGGAFRLVDRSTREGWTCPWTAGTGSGSRRWRC